MVNAYIFKKEDGDTISKYRAEFADDVVNYFKADEECQKVATIYSNTNFTGPFKNGITDNYTDANYLIQDIFIKSFSKDQWNITTNNGWTYEGALTLWVRYLQYVLYSFLVINEIAKKLDGRIKPRFLPSGYFLVEAELDIFFLNIHNTDTCCKIYFTLRDPDQEFYKVLTFYIKSFKDWLELSGSVITSKFNEEYLDIVYGISGIEKQTKENILIKDINGAFLKEFLK